MTLNIISDLHCGYDSKKKEIIWNGDLISNSNKKDCIYFLENFLKCFNTIQDISDKIIITRDDIIIDSRESFIHYVEIILDYFRNDFKNQEIAYILDLYDCCTNYFDKITNNLDIDLRLSNSRVYYILYDLHSSFIPEKLKEADYLIVAGDLGLDQFYQKVFEDLKKRTEGKFKDIFYIKGNHDYWWFPENGQTWNDKPDNINFDHRYIEEVIGDYVILGCTMWAPVRSRNMWNVYRSMNDYRHIPGLSSLGMYDATNKVTGIYQEESNWLRSRMDVYKGKKIIIVTHDLPRKELVEGKFSKSDVNDAYCVMDNSCDDIKPLVWIHGHSHSYCDITIDNVRYIRNPIGYRHHYGYVPSEIAPTHWYNTIVEV